MSCSIEIKKVEDYLNRAIDSIDKDISEGKEFSTTGKPLAEVKGIYETAKSKLKDGINSVLNYLDSQLSESETFAKYRKEWPAKWDRKAWKKRVVDILNHKEVLVDGEKVTINSIGDSYVEYSVKGEERISKWSEGETTKEQFVVDGKPVSVPYLLEEYINRLGFVQDMQEHREEVVLDLMNNPENLRSLLLDIDEAGPNSLKGEQKEDLLDSVKELTGYLKEVNPKIYFHINKNAENTFGKVINNKITNEVDVTLDIGPGRKNKSALEVALHELWHAVTEHAMNSKDPYIVKYLRSIDEIREAFVTDKDIINKLIRYMPDPLTAGRDARELVEYFSDRRVGREEFVAYAMTNPYVRAVLRDMSTLRKKEKYDNLAQKFAAVIRKLLGVVSRKLSGEPDSNDLDRMMWLTSKLAKTQDELLKKKERSILGQMGRSVRKVDRAIAEAVEKGRSKIDETKAQGFPYDKSVLHKSLYVARLVPLSLLNKKWATAMSTGLSLSFKQRPEETLQMLASDALEGDSLNNLVEDLIMQSQHVDVIAEGQESGIKGLLKESLGDLTPEEKTSLMNFMKIDPVVLGEYDLVEMLKNPEKLNEEISRIEAKLEEKHGKNKTNYYRFATDKLGDYMVTGKSHLLLAKNAHNIANVVINRDIRPNEKIKELADEETVQLIDELASMKAFKALNGSEQASMVSFLEEKGDSLETVVMLLGGVQNAAKNKIFSGNGEEHFYTKGYLSEIYPDSQELVLAPASREAELKKEGYRLLHAPKANRVEEAKIEHDLVWYMKNDGLGNNLHKTSVRYTRATHKGTTLTEQALASGQDTLQKKDKLAITKTKNKMRELLGDVLRGEYVDDAKYENISPIVDDTGTVVNFAYTMDNETKVRYLGLEQDPVNTLARTARSIWDKHGTIEQNKKMARMFRIMQDKFASEKKLFGYLEDRAISKVDGKEYIRVHGKSSNKNVREMWALLPKEIKDEFKGKWQDGDNIEPEGFYVRADIYLGTIGYREWSIGDFRGVNKLPMELRRVLRLAENIWQEIVKLAKVAVVLKMPFVLIENIMSNIAMGIMHGYSPIEVMRLQADGVRELGEYMRMAKLYRDLSFKVDAGKATKQEILQRQRAKEKMEKSSMHPLMEAGFYTQILEEIELGDVASKGKIQRAISSKLESVPSTVKNGLDWVFMTNTTKAHRFMYTATQYSDLVARYAQYHLMVRDGKSKEDAIRIVRDAYINYAKPNSPLVEWLNAMGAVMFTKYFARIQRAIGQLAKGSPLSAFLVLMMQEIVVEMPDVVDSSVLAKDVTSVFYNPFDIFATAVTPGSYHFLENVLTR